VRVESRRTREPWRIGLPTRLLKRYKKVCAGFIDRSDFADRRACHVECPFWVCAVTRRRFPVGASPRSSQQGCRSRRWETSAVNCPFGRLAYPMRGEVTNRVLLGRKRHGRPGIQSRRQRWERPGWQQTRRLEDHRMTAAAKSTPVLKSLNGFLWNSRPSGTGGRPM